MDNFEKFLKATKDSLWAVSNGQEVSTEWAQLQSEVAELRAYIASLKQRPDLVKARALHSQNTAETRSIQPFLLSYAGGGSEQLTSWEALAKRVNLRQSSIRVLLSKGKGVFNIKRPNPLTGEEDILTITRLLLEGQVEKPTIGRPPRVVDLERLGAEAASDMRHTKRRPR